MLYLFSIDIQYIRLISFTAILKDRITPLPKPMKSARLGILYVQSRSCLLRKQNGTGWCMGRLRVKCIKCGDEWEKDSTISWEADDYSSSLCTPCFIQVISPIIHRKQRSEGNFACFGKAVGDCDQYSCKYKKWCLMDHETGRVASR